jgi:hypothetical protein
MQKSLRAACAPRRSLLFALDPHADFTRLFTRLDVNDARTTAHRAIFGVGLATAAAQIDRKLVGLTAKRTFDDGGGSDRPLGHAFVCTVG